MKGFCRACLVKFNEPTELLNLTKENRRLFIYSTGLQVKLNDALKFQICKDCYVTMKLSCKFKKQCHTSDIRLKQYLSLKKAGDVTDLCTFIKNTEDLLNFSQFSIPRAGSNDYCITPQKTKDVIKPTFNNAVKNKMDHLLCLEKDSNKKGNLTEQVLVSRIRIKPIKDMQYNSEANYEAPNSLADLTDQTINLCTQNENEIAIQQISPIVNNEDVQTVNSTLLHSETEIAEKHVDLINAQNNRNSSVFSENKSISENITSDLNFFDNGEINDANIELLHESDVDLDDEEYKPKIIEVNSEQNENDIAIDQSNGNKGINITRNNHDIENEETDKNDANHQILCEPSNECHGENQNVESNINENIEKVLDEKDSKAFSLGDSLLSPAEFGPAPGPSKVKLKDDTNQSRVGDKRDVLYKILKEGVKEYVMDIKDKYDLDNCYCKVCDKKFKSIKELKIHLAKNYKTKMRAFDKRERICDHCGESFNNFAHYQRHVKRHEKTEVKCNECNLVFSTEEKLKAHSALHQGIQPVEKKDTKQFMCNICGVTLSTRENLAKHTRCHKKYFIGFCDECSKGFVRTSEYNSHMRQHNRERPFPCEYCNKSFPEEENLLKHMKSHLGNFTIRQIIARLSKAWWPNHLCLPG